MSKKVAFFDMDGTLAAPRFYLAKDIQAGFPPEVWKEFCNKHGEKTYDDCVPIFEAFAYADDLKCRGYDCIVLTVSSSTDETKSKEKWISEHNSSGTFSEIYCVSSDDEKFDLINRYAKTHNVDLKDCIIVEDNYYNVLKGIEIGIKAMHISHIFTKCYNAAGFNLSSAEECMTLKKWYEINKSIVRIMTADVELRKGSTRDNTRIGKVERMEIGDAVNLFGNLQISRVDSKIVNQNGYGSVAGFEITLIQR